MNVLGENTEKYKTFSVPIGKEVTNIDKNGNENVVFISHKIKFIDSARFVASSLSHLVDNLAEGIHKVKCKDCDCFLEYESVKDNLVKYNCLFCNKDYSNKFDEKLKKRFKKTFKFSHNDINRFILLLRKVVYPYEYMDDWEKFIETTLPEKEEFYSNLNIENIADAYYMHAKRVCNKDFEIKFFCEYHALYLKSDILLLANVFKNFRKMCWKIYHIDPVKFLSAPGWAWQADLKNTEVKLELSTDIHMLLMIEKWIRGGVCHTINRYAKAHNKYMKDYDKKKESSYLKYWDVNNFYVWAMSAMKKLVKNIFLKLMFSTLKNYKNVNNDLPFLPEKRKFEKVEKLGTNLHDKTEYVVHIRNLK